MKKDQGLNRTNIFEEFFYKGILLGLLGLSVRVNIKRYQHFLHMQKKSNGLVIFTHEKNQQIIW
jgi:ABC-type lipoprotein release transport system permease subunit